MKGGGTERRKYPRYKPEPGTVILCTREESRLRKRRYDRAFLESGSVSRGGVTEPFVRDDRA